MGIQGRQGVLAPTGIGLVVLMLEGGSEENWENSLSQARDCGRAAVRTGGPEHGWKRDAEGEGQMRGTWTAPGILHPTLSTCQAPPT